MRRFFTFILTLGLFCSCSGEIEEQVVIIPKPVKIEQYGGSYSLTASSVIKFDATSERLSEIAEIASMMIKGYTGLEIKSGSEGEGITLSIVEDPSANPESYRLKVDRKGILIEAPTSAGIFYGVQTLSQLIEPVKSSEIKVAKLVIEDYPRLEWRGLLLDVGRHFYTKDEVMKFIDVMSRYKLNKFHWHLTEDQGWRIEIKKYPLLTEVGGYRKSIGFPENQGRGHNVDDGTPYGGFYTQDEIKEVVEYAREREIEVIPEFEIPGHSMAALTAYPEFYCFPNEKLELRLIPGISDGLYCAGKEESFTFIEDVLTEIMELFPSKYIHIGGDEAPKRNWARCPLCQKRIKEEGLKDEHELQSYVLKRVEKFLNSHGRQIIGWDEILEGGVSPTTTVMSWRGVNPGIEAAEMGNKVIMTPGKPCYISQVQSINSVTQATDRTPMNTLSSLYAFNPVPKELSDKAKGNIMGVQACCWTENTPNFYILMYKTYPRAMALAEIAWTPDEQKDWDDFFLRVNQGVKYLDKIDVAHGQPSYDVAIVITPDPETGKIMLDFTHEALGDVYYTLDGNDPTKESEVYSGSLSVDKSCTIKARMFRPDGTEGRIASEDIYHHKAIAKSVKYDIPYSDKHNGGGDYGMTNGMVGKWQGFEKRDVDMTLDLGAETEISLIKCNWFHNVKDWVQRPKEVNYEVSSDGENFETVFTDSYTQPKDLYDKETITLEKSFDSPITARYIRIRAKNVMTNQEWHTSAGAAVWLFVDEIIVE